MAESKASSRNDFETIKVLARGAFGIALHVRASYTDYVLKEVNVTEIELEYGKIVAVASRTEHTRLQQFLHPNIATVYEAFEERYRGSDPSRQDCTMYYLVMEYCKYGDLESAIRKATEPFPEGLILKWTTQLLSALKKLHDHKFVHRDIKPKNIFLFDPETVKIGDFGLAQNVNSPCERQRFCTQPYAAPEFILGQPYTKACDIWSLGVTLYQIANRKVPNTFSPIENQPFSSGYSGEIRRVVTSMLSRDPERRPSTEALLADPLFARMRHMNQQPPAFILQGFDTSKLIAKPYADQLAAMQAAVQKGDLDYLRRISLHSQAFKEMDENNGSLLNIAATNGGLAVVIFLVERVGLNVEIPGQGGATPLLQACSKPGQLEVVRYFVEEKRANIFAENNEGWNAIHFAASFSDVKTVDYLLHKRPDFLEVRSRKHDRTAFLHAAQYGNLAVLQYLRRRTNADMAVVDNCGSTALHLAACYNHPEVVFYLIDRLPNLLQVLDCNDRTAIYWAQKCSVERVSKLLLDKKAIYNASSKNIICFARECFAEAQK